MFLVGILPPHGFVSIAEMAKFANYKPCYDDMLAELWAHQPAISLLLRNEGEFASMSIAVVDPFQKLPANK
jgi:hypothetical protein